MVNAFDTSLFDMMSLTDTTLKIPPLPLEISSSGLFDEQGVATVVILIEEFEGKLQLIPTAPRGAPPYQNVRDLRKARPFIIPHIPIEDRLMADEVQGVRAFGSESGLETVEARRNQILTKMSRQLDLTLEWHRLGAIKGLVLDADGSTLINLFTEFGVTQQTEVDWDLDNATPAEGILMERCDTQVRAIRNELGGIPFTGVQALAGSAFWTDLITHPQIRAAYTDWQMRGGAGVTGVGGVNQSGDFLRMGMVGGSFFFGGIMWHEYSWAMGSTAQVAIPADKANFYPTGVDGLFVTRYAPGNFLEAANTIGLPRYSKSKADEYNRWMDMHMQTNPINLCTRPRTLFQGRRT